MTPLTALLVDDDEFVRTTASRQLEAAGATRVETAADGAAALRLLDRHGPFGLIVCDLMLPGIDGVELLRSLAERQPQAALILISALDETVLRAAAVLARQRGLKVLGALRKPVRQDALDGLLAALGASAPGIGSAGAASAAELMRALEGSSLATRALPRVSLAEDGVCGIEMRVHWSRAGADAPLPHAQILTVAERLGASVALTELLLVRALQAADAWWRDGLHVPVSVSLPSSALRQLDLPDRIVRHLQRAAVQPERLRVGFAEADIPGDGAALDVLTRLRMRGVGVCIDDFGSGGCSYLRLQRVPATQVRFDARLLNLRGTGNRLLDHALHTARELDLEGVGDGVATAVQEDHLRRAGCRLIQGPLVSAPLEEHAVPAWAASRTGTHAARKRDEPADAHCRA